METDPLIRQWITRALDLTVILSGTKLIGAAISKQSINDFCNSKSHMKRCPISNTPYNCLTVQCSHDIDPVETVTLCEQCRTIGVKQRRSRTWSANSWAKTKRPWPVAQSASPRPKVGMSVTTGVFTSHANPKYFLFHPLHRIFGRMHGALNVGKKDN
jgi:hypothetical protein